MASTDKWINEADKLYELIMQYREQNQLPRIPKSPSLTKVARLHCDDLKTNQPHKNSEGNMHSWSDKGPWTPVVYYRDHRNSHGMWGKPSELTSYKYYGYEIAGMNSYMRAEEFLRGWQQSSGHNDVILNEGMWEDQHWKAIGVGICDEYSTVWFGTESDNA